MNVSVQLERWGDLVDDTSSHVVSGVTGWTKRDTGDTAGGRFVDVVDAGDVTLAGRPFAAERNGNSPLASQRPGQCETVGHRHRRREMTDHAHDPIVERSEVERAVATRRESIRTSQELAEQPVEVDAAGGPDAEISVHRQHPVVAFERPRHADRDRLLPDAREPFGEAPLPKQAQHLRLDGARKDQRGEE